jgi:hypothetical protein
MLGKKKVGLEPTS